MSTWIAEMNQMAAGGLAALLNTLWYAGAVVVLTWLCLRFRPRMNAATRYWIWMAVLASLIVLPFLPRLAKQARVALAQRPHAITVTAPLVSVPASPLSIRPSAAVMLTLDSGPRSRPWPLWLMAAWILAAAWQLLRLTRGAASVRRLKARAKTGSAEFRFPETLRPFFCENKSRGVKEQLRATFVTRRPVQALISDEIASPVAVGYRHPAVIIPPGLLAQLEEGEKREVMLHELAHLARYDDWMALLARALGALLVLHPLAAIVMGQIEREREMACDDFVVARTGSARSYARSLARLHDLLWSGGTRLLAAGLFGGGSSLGDRIELLLRRGRQFSARPSLVSLSVSALLLTVLLGAGGLMPGWIAFAQMGTAATRPTFEVASIKPDRSGDDKMNLMMSRTGRFSANAISTKTLIELAYRLKSDDQIVGAPSWVNTKKFNIEAKEDDAIVQKMRKMSFAEGGQQIRLMIQSLLADRFNLKASRETQERPVYALVVAKNGPKLTPTKLPPIEQMGANPPRPPGRGGAVGEGVRMRPGEINCMGVAISFLAQVLSRQPELGGRIVIDETGLKGRYDGTMKWTPEFQRGQMMGGPDAGPGGDSGPLDAMGSPSDSSGPSLFTALQEQLGLRLKPAKGPVEVLVIDHIEPPTPN